MSPITPVVLSNVSKKMPKTNSATRELAEKAMNELGGITQSKAKRELPHSIEKRSITIKNSGSDSSCGWSLSWSAGCPGMII